MDPLKLLLETLEDLTGKELKKFQLYLCEGTLEGFHRIPTGKLEKCDPTDTTDIMRKAYGSDGSLRITLHILKKMNRNDLADGLERELEKSIARLSNNRDKVPEDALQQHVSQHLKEELKRKHSSIFEGLAENQFHLDEVYTDVHVTEGVSEEVNTQHEVRQIQMQTKHQTKKDTVIKCNDIMNSTPGKQVRTVMTTGIAGIGKSVSVQKFCLDWAEGRANQDIDFIFEIPFRELNLLERDQHSLHSLLLYFYPDLEELRDVKIYKNSKILFIFDGLDESKLKLEFSFNKRLHDLNEKSSMNKLITNLIEGHLLPSSLIWVTSRPAATNMIPPRCIHKWTEIHGFNDDQKDKYFSRRIGNHHTDKIISQIKARSSLYSMCYIPVFCWILACVLQKMKKNMEIPNTVTELFIHFLTMQTHRKNTRHHGKSETDRHELLKTHKQHILRLSELAFKQLEKGNILFSKRDLTNSGFTESVIEEYSEMFKVFFKKDSISFKETFYCFVHLSFQEFLAALHVFYVFLTENQKAPEQLSEMGADIKYQAGLRGTDEDGEEERPRKKSKTAPHNDSICLDKRPLHVLLKGEVKKSLEFNNGHLDLFLRFLLGISLESNQELLRGLFPQVQESSEESLKITGEYIKKVLKKGSNTVERCQNLLLCLLEIKNNSLHEEIEELVKSGKTLTPAQCSLQAYMLLMSEDILSEFNLTTYKTSQEGRERLLVVLRGCRKAQLHGCGLSADACKVVSSNLQCENACLRDLDLSSNPLEDAGMELLSAGLKHTHCRLETLRLAGCGLSGVSCSILSSVLQTESSLLRALDLSSNPLKDSGVELLTSRLYRLEKLRLAECELTSSACQTLASVLQSDESHLTELDLTNNDLTDSGAKELCAALGHRNCKLEVLRLSGCLISQAGCGFIASALTSKSVHLFELDLSYNHARRQICSRLPYVNVDYSCEDMLKGGMKKYACELTLDPNTACRYLLLSEGNRKVSCEGAEQPYPDHPRRFEGNGQVLCGEPLAGRCYWECEWTGEGASVGVAHESISRTGGEGGGDESGLGGGAQSWSLMCVGDRCSVWHNNISTDVPAPPTGSGRVGVYLDRQAGTLSFYSVSLDTHTHTHWYTFHTTFTDEPLYAGFGVWSEGCSVALCQIT